jgi:bacteriorhodopsin
MATGDGIAWRHSIVHEAHKHVPDTRQEYLRQVFWARYINWILTNPLLIINIGLVAGLNGASILVAVSADLIMFASGLAATYARHERRWVWFAITCISYLTLVYQVGFNGHRTVANRSQRTRIFFSSFSGASLLLLALYPMCVYPPPSLTSLPADIDQYSCRISPCSSH